MLEVAVAGNADMLVTANLADFDMSDIAKVGDGTRVRIYKPAGRGSLVIAHPDDVCAWLKQGIVPTAGFASQNVC